MYEIVITDDDGTEHVVETAETLQFAEEACFEYDMQGYDVNYRVA